VFGLAKAFDKLTGVKIPCRELLFVFLTLFPAPGAAVTQALADQSSIQVAVYTNANASTSVFAVDAVTSWAQLVTACAAPSANINITLSPAFQMGAYTKDIGVYNKAITIFGSNAILDAGRQGIFFNVNGVARGPGSSLELHGITLKNGAGITVNCAYLMIYDSTFESNYGGAIYAMTAHSLEIHNTVFQSNTATTYQGGAIYATNGASVEIYDSAFISNTASDGGAIYATLGAHVEMHTVTFKTNDAYGNQNQNQGGAIYASNGAYVEIYDSEFISNTADYGGAIFAGMRGGSARIYTSRFVSNEAFEGGAIYASSEGGGARIYTSSFVMNQAYANGGMIYISGSLAAFNCTFHGNTVGKHKGGGAAYVNDGANATFTGCIFNGNDGTKGHNDITRSDDTSNVTFACVNGTVGAPVTMKAGESEMVDPPPMSLKCTASKYVCHRPGTAPGQCVVVPSGGVSLKDCVEVCT
jgi:predicted outer membrane repeat protein